MADNVFENLEQLIPYMLANLSLSRADHRFLESLGLFASTQHRVTTNQDSLLKKIIGKYSRQFAKKEYFITDLVNLQWKCRVIESSPVYTEAHISVQDSKLILRSPYNKNFIKEARQNPIYSMSWNRELRQYELEYNTVNLKKLIDMVNAHYPSINYCPVTTGLVNTVNEYADIQYWNPTLVYINGQLIVAAANQYLLDAISDVEFSFELPALAKLVAHGITIDYSVIHHVLNTTPHSEDQVLFATEYSPTLELNDVPNAIYWLKDLGCDGIYDTGKLWRSSEKSVVVSALNHTQIQCLTVTVSDTDNIADFKRPVMFNFKMFGAMYPKIKVFKEVRFVNSQPISLTEQ